MGVYRRSVPGLGIRGVGVRGYTGVPGLGEYRGVGVSVCWG